jgi:gluconolactonase
MKITTTLVLLLSLSLAVEAAEIPAPTGDAVVAHDAKLELLFTRTADIRGGLTEGPAVAPDGSIYFSDIPEGADKGMILRFDPTTKKTTVFTGDSRKSNGLICNRAGELLACEGSDQGGQAVARWNTKTGERKVLADKFNGKRFNACNDLCLDREGRIYFTDPRYLGDEPRELEHRAVYRLDGDGQVIEVTHDIAKPNGIAITPDGKTLIVADHDNGTDQIDGSKPAPPLGKMQIVAWPLGSNGLINGAKRVLIEYGDVAGCDGMTVDADGRIYLTDRNPARPGVRVIDQQGKELAFIPTGPADQQPTAEKPAVGLPSNVEFGIGKDANVLYITVDRSLYRIPLKAKGYHVQYLAR